MLSGEWVAAREFFTGVDFGMRNKMTGALFLACEHSLSRQPSDFWQRLTNSYTKRNHIIHRGDNASEEDARQAIAVASEIVRIMNAIPLPGTESPTSEPTTTKRPRKKGK